jgi:hypothetical protein
MGFSAGGLQIVGSGKVVGTQPSQGSAAASRATDPTNRATASGTLSLRFGIGTGSANLFCAPTIALAAGSSATYDLYAGTDLKDLFGQTAAFRTVRGFEVAVVDGGDASGVRIGGASSNEWVGFFASAGDQHLIYPDGAPYLAGSRAGKAVTSSAKNLKIENLGAVEVTIRVLLAGSSFEAGEWLGFGLWTYA